MLQSRRHIARLALRPYVHMSRGYTDHKLPDPTTAHRGNAGDKPVTEPIGGGDSSGTPSAHAASAGEHGPLHHANHPEPVNESLGRGFYATIAALALSFAIYKYSRSSSLDPADAGELDKQPFFTRLIRQYSEFQDSLIQRNALHTRLVEEAAHDRNLFFGSPKSQHVDLMFPEVFNTGSPFNIPAGHLANLDHLRAHYEKENRQGEEQRIARVQARNERDRIRAGENGTQQSTGFAKVTEAVGVVKDKVEKKD